MSGKWTVSAALSWSTQYLSSRNVPDPVIESEHLLTHVLKCDRKELIVYPDRVLNTKEVGLLRDVLARRRKREPIQYIIGEENFRGLSFMVNRDVLIPRPETELLVEEALREVSCRDRPSGLSSEQKSGSGCNIIDLCTGCGCIAISMAVELPDSKIYAIDISDKAIAVARHNAIRHGVDKRVSFFTGDLFECIRKSGLTGEIDCIISNPPYVSKEMMEELQPEIKLYEPPYALYGGEDGLEFYRRIIKESPVYLKPNGFLTMEIGYGQSEAVKLLIEKEMVYRIIVVKKDLAGIDRIVEATI